MSTQNHKYLFLILESQIRKEEKPGMYTSWTINLFKGVFHIYSELININFKSIVL